MSRAKLKRPRGSRASSSAEGGAMSPAGSGFDRHAIAECGEPEVAEQFMPMID